MTRNPSFERDEVIAEMVGQCRMLSMALRGAASDAEHSQVEFGDMLALSDAADDIAFKVIRLNEARLSRIPD